jgi:hypothetical protein
LEGSTRFAVRNRKNPDNIGLLLSRAVACRRYQSQCAPTNALSHINDSYFRQDVTVARKSDDQTADQTKKYAADSLVIQNAEAPVCNNPLMALQFFCAAARGTRLGRVPEQIKTGALKRPKDFKWRGDSITTA